jgi:hypothetical protein
VLSTKNKIKILLRNLFFLLKEGKVVMSQKVILISKVVCLLCIILISGCDKDETPTGPQFNSLEEEIDHIANQYLKVGATIGIINKQQERLIFSYETKYN